ncbi:MAG: ribonuclease D [Pseudomonadales bacterium]|nr:ribonuclease D [Pseudomonadales bacterium]
MNFPAAIADIDYRWVQDDATLASCCARWREQAAVALDTEFMRVSTFYPRTALLQLADADHLWLIDPLSITQWEPLRALMLDTQVVKVLHSCSEDLLVFLRCLGVFPAPLFDTQIAAAFLNQGSGISYQNLVKLHTGIELPKGETRSDWLQRPLTQEQQAYAALDVAYLLPLWQHQSDTLREQGRLSWLQEDCARLPRQYDSEVNGNFDDYYLNFKAAWQFAPAQRAALQLLAAWREQRARKRDKPRSWILKDTALYGIAQALPANRMQLSIIEDVSDNFVRFEGEQALALVQQARQLPEAQCPPPLPKPLSPGNKTRLRRAQDYIETRAAELKLPNEMLVRKRLLMELYYALDAQAKNSAAPLAIPAELQGWRAPLVLDDLKQLLQKTAPGAQDEAQP